MIVVVAIAVLAAAVFGWFQLRDRISEQGIEAADTCVEGSAVLTVAADPDISGPVEQLAARYNSTAPVIRDHCVTVQVRATASDQVRTTLMSGIDNWDAAALGDRPGLWIPQSSTDVEALTGRGAVEGTPRSLATSPVVLAAPTVVADALSASGASWADLVALQRDPQALGANGWGGLRLGLPTGSDSGATTLAVGAIAAGVLGTSTASSTVEQAGSRELISAMSELAVTDTGASAISSSTTYDALAALENAPGSDAPVHAVPVTEQQLASTDSSTLIAVRPQGPTPVADHPAVVLSGDETSTRTAAAFGEFVRQPDNVQLFADAGFGVGEQNGDAVAPLPGPVADALFAVLRNPVLPRRATIVLDVSESMGTSEGEATRLQNVVRALDEQFQRVPDATELGLWSFGKDLDGVLPYRVDVPTGPMPASVGPIPRRDALASSAAALTPADASSYTYASVLVAYADAVAGYVPGRTNSVVLVTDGRDDSPVSEEQFLADLTSVSDAARPVAVNVVTIGNDAAAFTALASRTGGTTATVPTSTSPELEDLLGKLLY